MDKTKIFYTSAAMNKKHLKGFKSSSSIANKATNKQSVYTQPKNNKEVK